MLERASIASARALGPELIVSQDPAGSRDPAWTVRRILTEPFYAAGRPRLDRTECQQRIAASPTAAAERRRMSCSNPSTRSPSAASSMTPTSS